MSVQDFRKNFEHYSICVYYEGWEYTYVESESNRKHAEYFKFSVAEPCEVYFRIHQDDERLFEGEDYQYSSADLMVVKVEDDGTFTPLYPDDLHIGAYYGERSIYPTKNMKLEIPEAGDYMVRTKIRWAHSQTGKYTLSAYAPFRIELNKTHPVKNFLRQFFRGIAKGVERQKAANNCWISTGSFLHYKYIQFENQSRKNWNVTMKFRKLENLKLDKKCKKGKTRVRVEVRAGTVEMVVLKVVDVTKEDDLEWEIDTCWN